ncbi:MAG: cyclic nucleotide-binding domain-containing protein [Alphaproteobacteria bacterium]|nr:cyclic nucleotide-binding domain-containing protein [Alphaproteobacteria bacterium]
MSRLQFQVGDQVFGIGFRADSAYLIVSGEIALCAAGVAGKQVLRVAGKGDLVGDIDVLAGREYTEYAIAKRNTEVLRIERRVFVDAIDQAPKLLQASLRKLIQQYVESRNMSMPVPDRP